MTLNDYVSVPLAISVVLAGLTCILLNIWRRNRNLPPGPWGIPFFGYYPFLSPKPYLDFASLAEKYGEVFSFRTAGGSLFVVLSGTKTIKEVLVTRGDEFLGRPLENNLQKWISDGMGVLQEEGKTWKEHRQYFLHTVKNYGFGKQEIEGTIQDEIKTLVEDLKKVSGQPVHLGPHVAYTLNSVIMKIMFARKLDKHGDVFPKLYRGIHDMMGIFGDNRFMLVGKPLELSMYVRPWSAKVRSGRSYLKNTVQTIIEEHVQSFDPNNLRDYVDSYIFEMERLRKSGQLENSSFTMGRLLAIAMNMTMEATESATICSLLFQASRFPEEQKRAQEELDAVIGREDLPAWPDRKKLPYVEAFIQELFRTAQAFSISAHYSNFEETKLYGYRIPKRSIVVGNLYSINNDQEYFENPSEFDVNRFLNEGAKKTRTGGPYPFSMGKRDCVGQSLAQMEVFLIVASMLQSFTLQATDKGAVRIIPRD